MTTELEVLLREFENECYKKMLEVAPKHPSDTVTDPNFNWKTYPIKSVEEHLMKEIAEWILASDVPFPAPHSKWAEEIDIGTVAFILWALRKSRFSK